MSLQDDLARLLTYGQEDQDLKHTHIRRGEPPFRVYCGAIRGPSISVEHYEMATGLALNREIQGHVDRLPEPLCAECGRAYDGS